MTNSRTQTTTTSSSTAGPSRSRPIPPPPIDLTNHEEDDLVEEEEDEDEIIRRAQARVERVRARKAAAAAKKAAEEKAAKAAAARERAAQEARERAIRARQQEEEVAERRRLLAEAATARSQRGTSPSEMSASPRRPVVEVRRVVKGKGKAQAQPVGGDPDDGDDGDEDDDDEEEREPCERCKAKKIPCLQQASKRSSVICKPCHDSKVRCSFSGRPSTVKREGGSGERIAVMESQMAQSLADLRALREANSKSHQYLRQLLRRQEDDHACLIAMETRMAMMGMGEGPAVAGPSSRRTEWRRPLKRRRVVEESAEEEEEEKEVEEEVEKDGEGEAEEMEAEEEGEGEAPAPLTAKTVASEKGKEKEVVA
ncbi:hypothetical protein F5877DRAFT_86718 [Lentinula edodes]|nr:hypothetical protein F5877DRAFT_86718 [Lentinula edodes]